MSQLTLFVLILIAGWLGWKRYTQARDKLDREIRERRLARNRGMPLEKDPETGIYRPPSKRS